MKPFLDLNEQILKIYSRGMHINSLEENKLFLLRKNYYNTINVYGRLFLKDPNNPNMYIDNCRFSEIQALYFFDKELRDLSFKKIIEVEANLRSTTSYIFSKHYQSKNNYLDPNSYCLTKRNGSICPTKVNDFSYLQTKFNKIVKKNYRHNKPNISSIDHYMRVHKYIPKWVMVNYLSFGDLITFIKLLEPQLINEIAKSFSDAVSKSYNQHVVFGSKEFLNNINLIHNLRNRIAHDNTLLFYKSYSHPSYSDFLHRPRNITSTRNKHDYFVSMITCQMFISRNNFNIFQNELQKLIDDLDQKLTSISSRKILSMLGFPLNWKV